MPLQYWWDSIFHFRLFDELTSNFSSQPPRALFKLKQKPNYHFLKSFGCACYPILQPYNKHKFEFHKSKCVFLGYSSNHKGYECLHSSSCLYITRNINFNETEFPFSFGSFLSSLNSKPCINILPK